jgi:hypothetical protein
MYPHSGVNVMGDVVPLTRSFNFGDVPLNGVFTSFDEEQGKTLRYYKVDESRAWGLQGGWFWHFNSNAQVGFTGAKLPFRPTEFQNIAEGQRFYTNYNDLQGDYPNISPNEIFLISKEYAFPYNAAKARCEIFEADDLVWIVK